MNRQEFLQKLRKNLKFLNKEELEKEMLYYINKIDASKLADKEVIDGFGKMEDIVKSVCEKHGLNYKTVKADGQFVWFKDFYNDLVELSNVLKNGSSEVRRKIIMDMLLLIAVTCVLKIPFLFVRDLGDKIIETLFHNNILMVIWGLTIEFLYVALALSFFAKTFKKWFKDVIGK